jgi:hypothetical protein
MRELYGQTEAEVKRLGGNRMLEAILVKLGVPEEPEADRPVGTEA